MRRPQKDPSHNSKGGNKDGGCCRNFCSDKAELEGQNCNHKLVLNFADMGEDNDLLMLSKLDLGA